MVVCIMHTPTLHTEEAVVTVCWCSTFTCGFSYLSLTDPVLLTAHQRMLHSTSPVLKSMPHLAPPPIQVAQAPWQTAGRYGGFHRLTPGDTLEFQPLIIQRFSSLTHSTKALGADKIKALRLLFLNGVLFAVLYRQPSRPIDMGLQRLTAGCHIALPRIMQKEEI